MEDIYYIDVDDKYYTDNNKHIITFLGKSLGIWSTLCEVIPGSSIKKWELDYLPFNKYLIGLKFKFPNGDIGTIVDLVDYYSSRDDEIIVEYYSSEENKTIKENIFYTWFRYETLNPEEYFKNYE